MSSTQEVGDIFGAGKGPAHAMLRSPTVLIVSVGLWGMNIFFFRLFGIQYKYVLNYDLMNMGELNANDEQQSPQPSQQSSSQQHQQQLQLKQQAMDKKDSSEHVQDDDIHSKEDDLEQIMTSFLPPLEIDVATGAATGSISQTVDAGTPHHHHHLDASIDWYKLVLFSIALLALLHAISYLWMDHIGKDVLGAVFLFYGLVFLGICLPLRNTNRWLRKSFAIICQRSFELIRPRCHCLSESVPRPIPFVDVFYADAMCSLSKVFFDWGMLLHMASHFPNPVPPSMHNIVIPSLFAAVPYVIRARQCLLMHTIGRMKNDPKRYQHFANAIKYSTSIFPLCLSAYQKTIDPIQAQDLEGLLILLLTINACYALYWDIVMDWGMMQNPTAVVASAAGCATAPLPSSQHPTKAYSSCRHGLLRPRLRFGFAMSLLILLADSILRFSWLLRFVPKAFPSPDAFILCTQFLEVVRRAIWNLLRIEWENIKQKAKQLKARDSLSDHEGDDDADYDTNGEDDDFFHIDGGVGAGDAASDEEAAALTTMMFPPKSPSSSSSKPIERTNKVVNTHALEKQQRPLQQHHHPQQPQTQQQQQQQHHHQQSSLSQLPTSPSKTTPKTKPGKVAMA